MKGKRNYIFFILKKICILMKFMEFKILENYIKHNFKTSTCIIANFGLSSIQMLTWPSYMYHLSVAAVFHLHRRCQTVLNQEPRLERSGTHCLCPGKEKNSLSACSSKESCSRKGKMLQPQQTMEVKWDFYSSLDLHLHHFERPVGGAT